MYDSIFPSPWFILFAMWPTRETFSSAKSTGLPAMETGLGYGLNRMNGVVETCILSMVDWRTEPGESTTDTSTTDDTKSIAELQTKLLEINLRSAPQVADAILESDDYTFSHYDKNYIARLCESARLFQRALGHYENLDDIKRVLQMGLGTNTLTADFLLKFFGDLTPEDALSCLRDLLQYQESGANLQLVVEVAKRYTETIY